MLNINELQKQLLDEQQALIEVRDAGKQGAAVVELDQTKVGQV